MSLAGKAATELKYGITDEGASSDLKRAIIEVSEEVTTKGNYGVGALDVFECHRTPSNSLTAKQEVVIQTEVERYLMKAKDILYKNREFLDIAAEALLQNDTLLNSDIKKLRESCKIIDVAV